MPGERDSVDSTLTARVAAFQAAANKAAADELAAKNKKVTDAKAEQEKAHQAYMDAKKESDSVATTKTIPKPTESSPIGSKSYFNALTATTAAQEDKFQASVEAFNAANPQNTFQAVADKTTTSTQPTITSSSTSTQPTITSSSTSTQPTITSSSTSTNPITKKPITPEPNNGILTPASIVDVKPPIKTASIDTVLFDDQSLPIETMLDLVFENIGGHELINIARGDIINGQPISYQPIKNIGKIQNQYNPNNILALEQTSDKYFDGYAIKLENRVPIVGKCIPIASINGNGYGIEGAYVYVDTSGSLIVEAVNLLQDEQIEIQINLDGTIYEATI